MLRYRLENEPPSLVIVEAEFHDGCGLRSLLIGRRHAPEELHSLLACLRGQSAVSLSSQSITVPLPPRRSIRRRRR